MYSTTQQIVIVMTQFFSAPLSAIASGTLMIMIQRSELKLNVTSRRIFFMLCFYDFVYSAAASFSSLPIPQEQGMWGSAGNITTCTIQGFLIQFGFVGSMLYNCALSIYYVSVIKFGMSEDNIKKKIEPVLHFIANMYPLVTSIYLLTGGHYNSADHLCWVAAVPKECADDPEIKCIRGSENVYSLRRICFGYIVYTTVCIIAINMTLIIWKVIMQKRKMHRWSFGTAKRSNESILSKFRRRTASGNNESNLPGPVKKSSSHGRSSHTSNHSGAPGVGASRFSTAATSLHNSHATGDKNHGDPYHFDLKAMRKSIKYTKVENKNTLARAASGGGNLETVSSSITPRHDSKAVANPNRASVKWNNDDLTSIVKTGSSSLSTRSIVDVESGKHTAEPHHFDLKAVRAKAKSERSLSLKTDRTISTGSEKDTNLFQYVESPGRPKSVAENENQGELSEEITNKRPSVSISATSSSLRNSQLRNSKRGSGRASIISRIASVSDDEEMKVMIQALLYISAFFSSVCFSGTVRVLESKGIQAPFFIYELSRIFSPLQGLFNILIYTRPYVQSLRSQESGKSWSEAFWLTIKTGGDNNSAGQGRRGDHKASNKIRERIERNHITRMAKIRADAEKKRRAEELQRTAPTQRSSLVGRRLSLKNLSKYLEKFDAMSGESQEDDEMNEKKMDGEGLGQTDLKQTRRRFSLNNLSNQRQEVEHLSLQSHENKHGSEGDTGCKRQLEPTALKDQVPRNESKLVKP